MATLLLIARHTIWQFTALFATLLLGAALMTLLSRGMGNIFRQFRFPQFGLYLFGWIGIPMHELSHAVFCKLFGHEVKNIRWFDPAAKDGAHGSVTHLYSPWNLYQRVGHFFIGIAPALLGPIAIGVLMFALVPASRGHFPHLFMGTNSGADGYPPLVVELLQTLFQRSNFASVRFYIFLYATICIASQIELSSEDLKQVGMGIIPLVLCLLLLNIFAWALGAVIHLASHQPVSVLWHLSLMQSAQRFSGVLGAVFVFAGLLSALMLLLCTIFFGTANFVLCQRGVNPFRISN